MTALIRLPDMDVRCARITARAKAAHETEEAQLAAVKAERAEYVRSARAVLNHPEHQPTDVLRAACSVLESWGDTLDYQRANEVLHVLPRLESLERHRAARIAVARETALRKRDWVLAACWGVVFAAVSWAGIALVML
jgi:CHASE3 domain sensor protein